MYRKMIMKVIAYLQAFSTFHDAWYHGYKLLGSNNSGINYFIKI